MLTAVNRAVDVPANFGYAYGMESTDVFCRNVTAILRKRKMSRSELAKRMDSFPSVVSRMLSGKNHPSGSTLAKVADALGVDASALLRRPRS